MELRVEAVIHPDIEAAFLGLDAQVKYWYI